MRSATKRRARRLALVMVAVPVIAWALEQAARRAEARDRTSPAGRPLASRLGRGPVTTDTTGDR